MAGTAIIVFREVLEAALIISIVMAATRGLPHRGYWVLGGVLAGAVLSAMLAGMAAPLSQAFSGMGQEIFNAAVLLAAVLMLAWHNVWMASHARELTAQMQRVSGDVQSGVRPLSALTLVIMLAVLREGAEVVLFLTGMAAGSSAPMDLWLGGISGLTAGAIAGFALYFGLLRIPVRHFFAATGWVILLLAAGLASEAARYLVQAGLLPALSVGPVWDTSAVISARSLPGQTLHALIGYTPRPVAMQVLVWMGTLVIIAGLMWKSRRPSSGAVASVAAIVLGGMMLGSPQAARAGTEDVVYSPIVDQGELELEVRAHRDEGGDQEHTWEVGYGFTNRWSSAIMVETENGPGEPFKAKSIAWENIIQLTEQGRYWLDAGVYVEYEHSLLNGGHDKLETKLLLEKQAGHFLHRANIIVEKELDGVDPEGAELEYAWQSVYRIRPSFNVGFEAYGAFGEIEGFAPASAQQHSIGPVLTGGMRLSPRWKLGYELGYQTGLTNVTRERVRALIELETRF